MMALTHGAEALLIEAVREAARTEILPRFRNLAEGEIATKTGPDDLVTQADLRAEARITETALRVFPDALIVGEEATVEDPTILSRMKDSAVSVVIDPVDGTGNFAGGLAVFGVILSVIIEGKTEMGVLYDPIRDDWIMARRGQGAQFVSAQGRASLPPVAAKKPAECFGYVSLAMFPKERQVELGARYARFRRIGDLRCSCHEYRMLATGQADFILAAGAKPWDHAAGALIVQELGGVVLGGNGLPYDPSAPQAPLWAFAHGDEKAQGAIISALSQP